MDFDLSNIIAAYRRFQIKERPELVREISSEVRGEREFKLFVAEIGEECVRQGFNPISTVAFTAIQGITVGILLERDRNERRRRVV